MKTIKIILHILGCCVLLFFFGCSSSEEKVESHFDRGQQYFAAGEYEAATIEFRNVIKLEPEHAAARYNLGLAFLKDGQMRKAFAQLQRAASLDPTNVKARLLTAELFYLSGKLEESREMVQALLDEHPGKTAAQILLVNIELKQENFIEAEEALQGALQNSPQSAKLHLLKAKLAGLTDRNAEAEQALLKALELDPHNLQTHQLLVNYYLQYRRMSEAEARLQNMIAAFPEAIGPRFFQASFYIQQKSDGKAEKVLLEAQQLFPANQQLYVMLAGLYQRGGRMLEAEAQLKAALEKVENKSAVRGALAELYVKQRRYDEAQGLVEEVLKNGGEGSGMKLVQAKLLHKDGKYNDALMILEGLAVDRPRWGDVYLQMGLIYLDRGQIELSHKNALLAVQYSPNSTKARTLAAHHFFRKGQLIEARRQAGMALKLEPKNIKAAIIIGQSYFYEGNEEKALQIFQKMNEILPNDDEILYNLAFVLMSMERYEEGLAQAEEALGVSPKYAKALALIVNYHLHNNDFDSALARIDEQLEIASETPDLLRIYGDTLLKMEKHEAAREAFAELQKLSPEAPHSYLMLARIDQAKGNGKAAIDKYNLLLEQQPGNIQALMGLGALQHRLGRIEEAEKSYETILAMNKGFAPAANNLAWLLLESEKPDLDRAMQLALKAKEVLPNDGAISDTLGYVFYKRGSYDLAVHQLRHAVSVLPDNPTIRLHLAKVLWAKDEKEGALAELEKCLHASADFPERGEVRKLLEAWRNS